MPPLNASFLIEQTQNRASEPVLLEEPISIDALPTPALVLDRPALGRNIDKMAAFLGDHDKGFRPHAKTHKCPLISREQIAAGAVGVCVAKVGEAAALLSGGIEQILITSPVTTPLKAQCINLLAKQTSGLQIVVDSLAGLNVLQAHLDAEASLGILLDIDVAMGRTGSRDVDLLLTLAEQIVADPRMTFAGVQHYAGHVMHIEDFVERRNKSLALWETVTERLQILREHGYDAAIVTGGGTGTYNIDVDVAALTDVQVGSYILMDQEYRQIGSAENDQFLDFEVSLHVACSTISAPRQGTMTVDGGYKAFASDSVAPVTDDHAGVKFHFAGDEHGVLVLPKGEQALQLGQVVQFVAPHCDPTVNLHDYYWVKEADNMIHSLWPITARGCVW